MQPQEIEAKLDLWPAVSGAQATLINHSENHTFRLDGPGEARHVLRVHRPGYNSRPAIESELAWMAALARDTGVEVPGALPGADGRLVQTLRWSGGRSHAAVLFEFVPGTEPAGDADLEPLFSTLGSYAARFHLHAESWDRPSVFPRPVWSTAAVLDPNGLWGDWRTAAGMGAAEHDVLSRADRELRRDLSHYGQSRSRYGLIHADMRLANLLVEGSKVRLIDFDDCGYGWFGYDFAASLSFFEDSPQVPALRAAWLDGYAAHRRFSEEDVAALDPLIMLRRFALLAWIGSHAETPLAQSHAPDFAANSVRLAERYLATGRVTAKS